jgi:hypothetical protein
VLGGLLTIAGVALAALVFARAKGISVVPQRTAAVPGRTAR